MPGFWQRVWAEAEAQGTTHGHGVLFLDEVHLVGNWAARLVCAPDEVAAAGRLGLHAVPWQEFLLRGAA